MINISIWFAIVGINPDDSGRRARTVDNLINSQVLYQLSYAGII